MDTTRPTARATCARTSPANCNAEGGAIQSWDDDIVRASRACARRRGLNGEHPFAENVAQDVRLAIVLAGRRIGVDDERYIRRVISNGVKNSARQTQVAANEVSDDALDGPLADQVPCDVLAVRRVRQWICRQPTQLQAVFDLLYHEDLTQREAALRLGVSQPRVAKLHRQLVERGSDELRDLAA